MVIHLLHRIQIACLQPTSTKPSAIHRSSVLLRTFPHPPSASLVLHLFQLLQTNMQSAILCTSCLHHCLRILINYRFHMHHSLVWFCPMLYLTRHHLFHHFYFHFHSFLRFLSLLHHLLSLPLVPFVIFVRA